jgi:uncharacterized protein YxjI
MFGRDRKQQRENARQQNESAPQPSYDFAPHRYQMKERLFSIGDDFYIRNDRDQPIFYVDGKALRLRETLIFRDMEGRELYHIQEKVARIRDTYNIYRDNEIAATVRKAIFSPLRQRFSIDLSDGEYFTAQGNILDHEYTITKNSKEVAQVSKYWFHVRDTYGVEIAPDENDALILAITAVIDMMS